MRGEKRFKVTLFFQPLFFFIFIFLGGGGDGDEISPYVVQVSTSNLDQFSCLERLFISPRKAYQVL